LIAQHFSILRELYNYCQQLKQNVRQDENADIKEVWKNFNHLVEVLEAGCDFLYYPVKF
jgi:HPt (histidine-containing phosphotransfer) domain-containing protein